MVTLKERIQEDMKQAMRAKDAPRLSAIRLILAAIKQREVDERIVLDDEQVISILNKMLKQRRDSISQYQAAQRQDLVEKEEFEVTVIQAYLPAQLSEQEVSNVIQEVVANLGASSPADMGKVMAAVKAKIQGRADMTAVSAKVKEALS